MGISPAKKLDLPAFFLQQMKQMDTWGFHLQSGWIFRDVHSEKPWASSISRGTTPNSHGRYVVMASMSLTPLKILKWKGGQLHMAQWFSDIQLIALLSGYSIFPAPFFFHIFPRIQQNSTGQLISRPSPDPGLCWQRQLLCLLRSNSWPVETSDQWTVLPHFLIYCTTNKTYVM